ncbi:SGNH/GDSL hydrolase family protein [Psychromicrobium sp. YIM B11713]|uniref:SGNH/GDSL hydrolase family protein n=1 Tax=Psychromicrobium sp. YIM B11713 TaxID=3145233 RepID=UPI00374EF0C9
MMHVISDLTELIHGTSELETTARGLRPHRLPLEVRKRFPDPQLLMVEAQPSGVRLRFRSEANSIELVLQPTRVGYRGAARPRGAIDLFVDGEFKARDILDGGDLIEADVIDGSTKFHSGENHLCRFEGLPAGDKDLELWLPHNESIELVELRTDAPVHAIRDERPRWLHHGSSISHGSNASGPSEIWPAIAAQHARLALQNLGFGGSALLDPFVARVIRDSAADLISLKIGINIVNLDSMRLRAFVPAVHGFLDTIREGHPQTPLLLISPILCPIHEDVPGPGSIDIASLGTNALKFIATGDPSDVSRGKLNLKVIRRELESIVEKRADPNLHYLDGTALYGEQDAVDLPLPDNLHPDTRAHRRIGERFAEYAFAEGGPFSGTPRTSAS